MQITPEEARRRETIRQEELRQKALQQEALKKQYIQQAHDEGAEKTLPRLEAEALMRKEREKQKPPGKRAQKRAEKKLLKKEKKKGAQREREIIAEVNEALFYEEIRAQQEKRRAEEAQERRKRAGIFVTQRRLKRGTDTLKGLEELARQRELQEKLIQDQIKRRQQEQICREKWNQQEIGRNQGETGRQRDNELWRQGQQKRRYDEEKNKGQNFHYEKPDPEKNNEQNFSQNSSQDFSQDSPKPPESNHFIEFLLQFIGFGPGYEGVFLFTTGALLYGVTCHYYNKGLSPYGGGLTYQTRVGLIFINFCMNLALVLYYLDHGETFLGLLLLRLPMAFSPLIFLLELICVFLYYRYVKKKQTK